MRVPRLAAAGSLRRRGARLALGVALALAPGGCGKTIDAPACRAPVTACSGACVDIAKDAAHCGSCDAKCPAGDRCLDGACASTGCPAHRHDCDGLCVDLGTNPVNCGACNVACDDAATCMDGACACVKPARLCGGVCTDVRVSQTSCGTCGNACADSEKCEAGACVPRCAAPLVFCGGRCVDPSTDAGHCGTCDVKCATNEQCVGGACTCPPDTLHRVCGGVCMDVSRDGTNCGDCGVTCPAGTSCAQGRCDSFSSCAAFNPFAPAGQNTLFFCPSAAGDPLTECLAQARTATPVPPLPAADGATLTPLSPDLACQCQHCLPELTACTKDVGCVSAWACGEQKRCTSPCWGAMGECGITQPPCFKFCTATLDIAQSQANVEALFRCTRDNRCGL